MGVLRLQKAGEFRSGAEIGEGIVGEECLAVVEALIESLSEPGKRLGVVMGAGKDAGEGVGLARTKADGRGLRDVAVQIGEGLRIEGDGGLPGGRGFIGFVLGEEDGAEIPIEEGGAGAEIDGLADAAESLFVVSLRVMDGAEIVERFRVVRVEAQGLFVITARRADGEEVVVRHAELVLDGCGILGSAAKGIDGGRILAARKGDIAELLG